MAYIKYNQNLRFLILQFDKRIIKNKGNYEENQAFIQENMKKLDFLIEIY